MTAVTAQTRTDVVTKVDGNVITVAGTSGARTIRLTVVDPAGRQIADDTTAPTQRGFRFDVAVPSPLLWWPNGYGPQHVYRVRLEADGVEVADRPVGFRTLSVAADGFRISVNGTAIFCRGVTWSPRTPSGHSPIPIRFAIR